MKIKYIFLLFVVILSPLLVFFSAPLNELEPERSSNYVTENKTSPSQELTVLIVLMEYPDLAHHPLNTPDHYRELFFSRTSGLPTVQNYYREVTYYTVELVGVVLGWCTSTYNHSYYANKEPELALEAFITARDVCGQDPKNYNLFVVMHAGDGQEYSGCIDDIWSHSWDIDADYLGEHITQPYTMNHEFCSYDTPAHELGHALGLNDLYDFIGGLDYVPAGEYCIMANGAGHFSIWSKYYNHIAYPNAIQILDNTFRKQITDFSSDQVVTITPMENHEPVGTMWLELDWDNAGLGDGYGYGYTVSVSENLGFDSILPDYGLIVGYAAVGSQSAVNSIKSEFYPCWTVQDSHPETLGYKEDAPFSLDEGDIGTFVTPDRKWGVQILQKYENLSYSVRVSDGANFPIVTITPPTDALNDVEVLTINTLSEVGRPLTKVEVSIDNGPWLPADAMQKTGTFGFSWNTELYREGTHIIRARAYDNAALPYIGYSDYQTITIDNYQASILVVDDTQGSVYERDCVLTALDQLGVNYELMSSNGYDDAVVNASTMAQYKAIIWISYPGIYPGAGSHINYDELMQFSNYLQGSGPNPARLFVIGAYNFDDFSGQSLKTRELAFQLFHATSPINYRARTGEIHGEDFLASINPFYLGQMATNVYDLYNNRSTDGEIVDLYEGAVPVLRDTDPVFTQDVKGFYVKNETANSIVNFYLFQPHHIPTNSLCDVLLKNLNFFHDFSLDDIPPSIINVIHYPAGISSSDGVKIAAIIKDDYSGIAKVSLNYLKAGIWINQTMIYNKTSGYYESLISPPLQATISCQITIQDNAGNTFVSTVYTISLTTANTSNTNGRNTDSYSLPIIMTTIPLLVIWRRKMKK